jgi:hypothetical protein
MESTKERNKTMKKQTERRIREVFSVQYSVFRGVAHALLFTFLALFLLAGTAQAVEALNTGGYVTYVNDGLTKWTYHVFTNAGASGMKLRVYGAGGTVELLVVAGGGSGGGGTYHGAGGGAGGLIYSNYTVTHNTDYAVTVGAGGVAVTAAAGKEGEGMAETTPSPAAGLGSPTAVAAGAARSRTSARPAARAGRALSFCGTRPCLPTRPIHRSATSYTPRI